MHSPPRPLLSLAVAAMLLVGAAGCVNQRQADASVCAQPDVTLAATLPASGKLQPENLVACQDQHVTLAVSSQRDGALHLHGYDDQNAEIDLTAGDDADLRFVASHVGQFVLELHPADGSDEVQVGTLTVNVR